VSGVRLNLGLHDAGTPLLTIEEGVKAIKRAATCGHKTAAASYEAAYWNPGRALAVVALAYFYFQIKTGLPEVAGRSQESRSTFGRCLQLNF
jgi:hypothetical protein